MDLSTLITLILAVIASNGIWSLIQNRLNRKDEKADARESISKSIEEINIKLDKLDIIEDLSISTARSKLNDLNHKYLEMGCIPDDEYANYKLLGEAYIDAKGNSEVKEVFILCMKKYGEYE